MLLIRNPDVRKSDVRDNAHIELDHPPNIPIMPAAPSSFDCAVPSGKRKGRKPESKKIYLVSHLLNQAGPLRKALQIRAINCFWYRFGIWG